MRTLSTLAVAAVFLPIGAAAAQNPPAVTDVRHVRWIWKAEFELPTRAHAVIVDWHPEFGIERRFPRRGDVTRPFEAGGHTVVGDEGRAPR